MKTWWYPGNTIGREFIYPKSQARPSREGDQSDRADHDRLTNVTNEQMQTADLAYVSPTGQDTPLTDEQLVEAAANTPPVGVPETPAQTAANAQRTERRLQEGTMARSAACRRRARRWRESACWA